MYAREVGRQVLDFGVSGKLYRNVLVMFDRQTDSLWSQLLGQAIVGPLKGTRLTMLPATVMTWGAWRNEHPDGLLLRKEAPSKATYASYWNSGTVGVAGETLKDARLLAKQYVVGVRVADQPKAYPYAQLSTQPVVNDTLGGTPLVVVFDEAHGGAGIVFSRQVQDRVLTFALQRTTETTVLLTDEETGTLWHGLTGEGLEGPLAGQRLRQLPATDSFWFGWKDHFPNTAVWGE